MADLRIAQAQADGYCVYFAERDTDALIKIGYTSNLKRRLEKLQYDHQCEMFLLGAIFTPHRPVVQKMERNILSALGCTFKGKDHEWLDVRRADICRVARVFDGRPFISGMVGFSEDDEPDDDVENVFKEGLPIDNPCKKKHKTARFNHLCPTLMQQKKERRYDDLMLYIRHEGI